MGPAFFVSASEYGQRQKLPWTAFGDHPTNPSPFDKPYVHPFPSRHRTMARGVAALGLLRSFAALPVQGIFRSSDGIKRPNTFASTHQ